MAGKKRAPVGRGNYEVGYCRPPVDTRWQKGQSGNPGRQSKSPPPPDPGPPLGDPMKDAVLKVMGETVSHEVRPGKRMRMPRAEALVRELASRAEYDPRAFKQITEMYAEAHRMQTALRREIEQEEELRRQREVDEEMRREAAQLRLEEEKRYMRALKREEKMARERAAAEAAQVAQAAELERLCLAAKIEAARKTVVGEGGGAGVGETQADAVGAREAGGDDHTYEDARLCETSDARPRARPAAPRVPGDAPTVAVSDGAGMETVPAEPTGPVRRRHSREPMIPAARPCAGHGYGIAGQASPPPPRFS